MRLVLILVALVSPMAAMADILVPTRTLRAQTIIAPADVTVIAGEIPGALISPDEAIGLEARIALYPGRPIRFEDVGPAAIIDRNDIVGLVYAKNGLRITTEARAMARASVGDSLRVMNLASRAGVIGIVAPDGTVHVGTIRDAFN